jgi:uncharacterized protein
MTQPISIIKLNAERGEVWRYSGKELQRSEDVILIEAFFNREDMPFHGITFGRNDRFIEAYFTRRWYNIYEIYDRDDRHFKGWYCNVCMPAEIDGNEIRYVDLALDLLVFPDGRQLILDEDEFSALKIDVETQKHAQSALLELQTVFQRVGGVKLLDNISAFQ